MSEDKISGKGMKIDVKSIVKVVGLLYVILIIVGILTYVLPAGRYETTIGSTGKTAVVPGTFEFIESETRIPWYRWLTAPFETLFLDSSLMTMYQIIAMLLLLGGCFKVLDECGAMPALIKVLIVRFRKRRFLAVCVITLLMMLLSSFFGLQEEMLILFPIFITFAHAMHWENGTALSLVLITTGVGFTCALLNPLTVGVCSKLAGVSVLDGIWYRAIMFVILCAVTCVFMVRMAKKDEKAASAGETADSDGITKEMISNEEYKKAYLVLALFGFVLLVVLIFSAVPALADLGLGLIIMAAAFVVGTVVLGRMMIGSFRLWFSAFLKGVKDIAPSIFVIVTAFSIKYIAEKGDILHTIFYYMSNMLGGFSPYVGILIILGFILILEFFIPSATAKASLLIPLLTLAPIPGISTNVIILAYLLGDGYTNVLYPTCSTLMIGLGLANVSYTDWIKRTGLFQLLLLATSALFLWGAIAIGL